MITKDDFMYREWAKQYFFEKNAKQPTIELYNEYYEEGAQAFYDTKDPQCCWPFSKSKISQIPWQTGYLDSSNKYFDNKYKLEELNKRLKDLIASYGLTLQESDGYDSAYITTPEGYSRPIL